MGDRRTFDLGRKLHAGGRSLFGGRTAERLRHVVWAGLISLALYMVLLLQPIDQFLWLFQSRVADKSPTGDIVFVVSDDALNNPDEPKARYEVANALDELDRRGVGKVYLDIAFPLSEDAKADARLARAIADLGPRLTLVDRIVVGSNGEKSFRSTAPAIGGNARRVLSDQTDGNWFGLAWEQPYSYTYNGKDFASFGAALGGVVGKRPGKFKIDYGFPYTRMPQLSLDRLLSPSANEPASAVNITGNTVVLGHDQLVIGAQRAVPGKIDAPASYVDIYAGETLRTGRTGYLKGAVNIAIVAAALFIIILLGLHRRRRWTAYATLVLLLPVFLALSALMGIRLDISYASMLIIIFAGFRWRARWKRRVEMVNPESGLPKLRALEAKLVRDGTSSGHLVIAKIQNYERVIKSLKPEDRGAYVLKLVDRLRAADMDLAVYNEGHHLGWYVPSDQTNSVTEHLEGLRAIFAAPVRLGGFSIDVGITFGVAAVQGDPSARMAAAVAAAEETSEALNPIAVAEAGSQSDLLWDISLRARIDEAMEAGEIYCVYQPKIDMETRAMVGVEALVRWHDPARGFISPMHFIQQCEQAGRMEHLTRFVLHTACSAAQALHDRGRKLTMSVNLSATMLSDMRVVGVVRTALEATQFDPTFLTLEITETARISDHSVAATILDELKSTGARISMDDFGVGAASYEAFYELPFDELKIDRLFVANMSKDPKARAIVASIAAMGRDARITVVAEGLENLQDIDLLQVIGCHQVQGFAISRPVSLSNLLKFNGPPQILEVANMV